jgi:hypothetical protein
MANTGIAGGLSTQTVTNKGHMSRLITPLRPLNKYGAPEDIATDHGWVHSNLQIFGARVPEIVQAFKTDDPFTALGYREEDTTRSIAKWYARPCKLDDSYLISWESYLHPPREFCNHLATNFNLNIRMEYTQNIKPLMLKEYFNWHKPIPTYQQL